MDSGNVRVDGTSLQRGTPPSVAAPAWGEESDAATLSALPLNVRTRIRIDEAGCWLWCGATQNGYGSVQAPDKKVVRVHRLAYQILRGPIPAGLVIDHLCRVRHCANPWHLEVVTNRENVLRGEGASARNARKTHCLHGHEFTEGNTMRTREGGRICIVCRDRTAVRREQRRRASA